MVKAVALQSSKTAILLGPRFKSRLGLACLFRSKSLDCDMTLWFTQVIRTFLRPILTVTSVLYAGETGENRVSNNKHCQYHPVVFSSFRQTNQLTIGGNEK